MIEKTMYECEECNEVFDTSEECILHEQSCGVRIFLCQCCGNKFEYKKSDYVLSNKLHTLDLGVFGYGSAYDCIHVKANVCEDCLTKWFLSFKNIPEHEDERRYFNAR